MHLLPLALGILAIVVGIAMVAFGIPINEFGTGNTLISAGTTAIVAERYGRDWLGIELNPSFAQLASARIQAARERGETRTAA